MAGHLPSLDHETLVRLRGVVKALHDGNGRAVPLDKLVDLARNVRLDGGVTIDFAASRELGQPMVVLRAAAGRPAEVLARLSKREAEIAALLADGLSNKQIARRLHIALATVKDHVHRILTKTDLPNRAAIAAAHKGHVATPHDGTGRPVDRSES